MSGAPRPASDTTVERTAGSWKDDLRQALQSQLERELSFWFPACVDVEGFKLLHASLPPARVVKSAVYQSRLTWTAAQVILARPWERSRFESIVRHGLAFLRTTLWDTEYGGLYWEVREDGVGPTRSPDKHLYGQAFGMYAAATVYRATGAVEALDLAQEIFDWIERHGHDARDGGYVEVYARDGTPETIPPMAGGVDVIGTNCGCKSMNATIHVLEALTALYRVWPVPAVKQRLSELLTIMRERVVDDAGTMPLQFHPDWRPVPGPTSWGHNVETAFLLIEAAEALDGQVPPSLLRQCRGMVDTALRCGWDAENSGFFERGDVSGKVTDARKEWWSQAEGLNALVMMNRAFGGETALYRRRAVALWAFIERTLLVGNGAWWFHAREHRPPTEHWTPSVWQTTYHTVRAELHVLEMFNRG